MKPLYLLLSVLVIVAPSYSSVNIDCMPEQPVVPKEWITSDSSCLMLMKDQVQTELQAAVAYMSMAAHFSRDNVNRLGFAKFFFESASEERQHAIKLIEYMLMRGELVTNFTKLINYNQIKNKVPEIIESGENALEMALTLETEVTKSIREIIKTCESPPATGKKVQPFNDYHLVDYLTGEFLTEQYEGQRDIAGKLVTLKKMMASHKELGEFLFDKKLLSGEV